MTTSLGVTLNVASARRKNLRAASASRRAETKRVDDLSVLVDGSAHIPPHAVDLDVRLVDEPPVAWRMTGESRRVGQQRREPAHPPIDGDMIGLDVTFDQQFLDVSVGQVEPQIPARCDHDHFRRESESRERGLRRQAWTRAGRVLHCSSLPQSCSYSTQQSHLHTYLLCVTRKADGTDAIDTIDRVVLSCPGPDWCRRGGCPADAGENETGVMAAMITEYADAAMAAQHHHRWPSQTYNALYGPGAGADDSGEHVVDYCETASTAAGWTVIGKSQAAGGMEELLLRRDQRFIMLSYDPLTRQIQLADGQPGIKSWWT